ncbi:hypothetical protein GCM10023151_18310 [Kangiella marina]|uniref:Uncharacterized protein n=1 Tax=Kangiella marina TaxID=1079178 RepID=A0ABP8IMY7_9GAMM
MGAITLRCFFGNFGPQETNINKRAATNEYKPTLEFVNTSMNAERKTNTSNE